MHTVEARVMFNGCFELFLKEVSETLGLVWFNVTNTTAQTDEVTDFQLRIIEEIAARHDVQVASQKTWE